ncbi:MAG: citrate transporter [Ignavibacteria bacterium]|nr:citrate transporter [Ignavibacteria bacterium]
MQIIQLILLLFTFLLMSTLMFLRKLPALLALPIMSILIPLIAGVNVLDILQYVVGEGAVKLSKAYTIAIFGSMLSVFLQKTGIAESFIKKGAELSGDKPWTVAVLMLLIIVLLFTTLGGLGAIIMVATIVLPIMSSVGIGPLTITGIFLLGLSIGGTLNAGNWALYIEVMKLSPSEVREFALIMFSLTFLTALVYITIQLYRDGQQLNLKRILLNSLLLIIIVCALFFAFNQLSENVQSMLKEFFTKIVFAIKLIVALGLLVASVYNLIRLLRVRSGGIEIEQIHWTSYLTPFIPLILILLYNFDFIAAFICGLIFGVISAYRKGMMNIFVKSAFEGGSMVMPAVVLMFGIGMLLNSIMGPGESWNKINPDGWPVLNLLQPLLKQIVPKDVLSYVLTFTILAPLALYRGPLNVWGMGYGLASILLASGMNPGAVMGLLLAVGQIQGVSDPTNTHNVWLANEMKVDVQKILWNTLPYTWIVALIGLIAAGLKFMM